MPVAVDLRCSVLRFGVLTFARQLLYADIYLLRHKVVCLGDGYLEVLIIEFITLLGDTAYLLDYPTVDCRRLGLFGGFEIEEIKEILDIRRA